MLNIGFRVGRCSPYVDEARRPQVTRDTYNSGTPGVCSKLSGAELRALSVESVYGR